MPVCILGMHRSGTSMVTRLLHHCGLYLGPEDQLLDPQKGVTYASPRSKEIDLKDNPAGYWENIHFIYINDEILKAMGGDFINPPELIPGWSEDPRVIPARHRVKGLLSEFEGKEPWGWKDPRNSLTIEFWQNEIPDLKVVLCIRNPLEIAYSIKDRNVQTLEQAFDLWLAYYETLLSSLQKDNCIVTHFETYFYDPKAELKRVLTFLGIPTKVKLIKEAVETVSEDFYREMMAWELRDKEGLPLSIQEHYTAFCLETGPVYERMKEDISHRIQSLETNLQRLHDRMTSEVKDLQKGHQKEIEKIQDEHLTQLNSMKDAQKEELARVEAETHSLHYTYKQRLTRVKAEARSKQSAYEQRLKEVKTEASENQSTQEVEIRRLNTELEQKDKDNAARVQRLFQEYEDNLKKVKTQHQTELDDYMEEIARLREKYIERDMQWQIAVAELTTQSHSSGFKEKKKQVTQTKSREKILAETTRSTLGNTIWKTYQTIVPDPLRARIFTLRKRVYNRLQPIYYRLIPQRIRSSLTRLRYRFLGW
jgi:hypothetical protein